MVALLIPVAVGAMSFFAGMQAKDAYSGFQETPIGSVVTPPPKGKPSLMQNAAGLLILAGVGVAAWYFLKKKG